MSRSYIGPFFDEKTRFDISKEIQNFIKISNKTEFDVINVGSPYLWELYELPADCKQKINVIALDKDSEKSDFAKTSIGFKTSKFIQSNWFNYNSDNKYDIIITRWFLHHLTTNDTKEFYKVAKKLLKPGGIIVSVDYFFKKFYNHQERMQVGLEYNKYHSSLTSQPTAERWAQVINNCEISDWKGGKMDCAENIQLYLEELGFTSTIKYCTDSLELDNPELWGQKIIISK